MGDMWSLGQRHGVEINREPFTASSFDDPTKEDSVLVSEVLSFGFRVPPAQCRPPNCSPPQEPAGVDSQLHGHPDARHS
jgi:hypothetical protein